MPGHGAARPERTERFGSLHLEEAHSTVERVAEELRRGGVDGEGEGGTPLREIALAESLGVSRPTVREALTMLVAEGLATREPNRGVSVTAPQAESVRDVCRARRVLEGAGVRNWPDASPAQRERVRTTLDAYISAVHTDASYQELNARHLAFHVSLAALTGSERIEAMAESLAVELRLSLAQVERIRRNSHDQADSHAALVRLLEDDDVEGASAFLEQHLIDAEASITAALQL